jgi:hypothetical protein
MDNPSDLNPKLIVSRTLRRLLDRRLLTATINVFYRPASSHLRNGIPPRAEVYRLLYREALGYARAHAEIWGISVAELHARIPALEHLRILSGDAEPETCHSSPLLRLGSALDGGFQRSHRPDLQQQLK